MTIESEKTELMEKIAEAESAAEVRRLRAFADGYEAGGAGSAAAESRIMSTKK